MKNYRSMSARAASSPNRSPAPHGFTLVELLVVITIIGILVGLTIPAVMIGRVIAKQAAISMELNTGLQVACFNYKGKTGELPPDFSDINDPIPAYQQAARSAVLRHLAKAYPRFSIPGATVDDKWDNLQTIVFNNWGVNINFLSPASALTFWLGGKPKWRVNASGNPILPGAAGYDPLLPVQGFLGFSADPSNPFNNSTSRIKPFFEINPILLNDLTGTGCFAYWPKEAVGSKTTGPIVYFRAENSNYTKDGLAALSDFSNVKNVDGVVWPAFDSRLSNPPGNNYVWINPESVQIFSSGLDVNYGAVTGPLWYPTGDNYQEQTYDDITNFSDGTLENAMP